MRSRPSAFAMLFPIVALVFTAAVPIGRVAAAEAAERISSADADRFVGETVTVCGVVVGASHFDHIRGEPTFLNFDKLYPNQTFTVVIWGENNARFERPPHLMFAKKEICVTGTVETYKGKPQIEVRNPDQIELVSSDFEAERFSYEERVMLKAMLSALGYEVDYGTGEWDAGADRALRAFQDAARLADAEDRDPRTLRALAEAVGRLNDEDRTRILRLLLLNLAQREEAGARK